MLLRALILGVGLSVFTQAVREGEGGGGPGTAPGSQPPGNQPPAPAVAPWGSDISKPWMLGDAASAKPWYEVSLPDGPTKEFVRSKNYGNPAVMADALFSANRMVNGNAVEIPSIDGDPKQWDGFNAKMRGDAIKAPADYKFSFGKDAEGNEIPPDPDMLAFGQQLAFDLGIHPKRAQEMIVNRWQEFAQKINARNSQTFTQENEAEANGIRQKWGANFETLRAGGERVVRSLGLDAGTLSAIESHIGAAPLLDLFAKIGQAGAEGKLVGGGGSGATDPANQTAEQVQAAINAKRADAAFNAAFNDRNNPNHAAALAELEGMYKLLESKRQRS